MQKQLKNKDKETLIELNVYDALKKIESHVKEWFEIVHIENESYPLEHNIVNNIEYYFSVGYFWVEVGELFGLKIKAKESLDEDYAIFKEKGYKHLLLDIRYDYINDRVRTKSEIEELENGHNKLALEILDELNNESSEE